MTVKSKANLLASTFAEKFDLPDPVENEYINLEENIGKQMSVFLPVRLRLVRNKLKKMDIGEWELKFWKLQNMFFVMALLSDIQT